MKNKYVSPLFQLISAPNEVYCADDLSSEAAAPGLFGGNADSLRDEDYE